MDINSTYYGDHFIIHTNIEALHCTPGTNIMMPFVNYFSLKLIMPLEVKITEKKRVLKNWWHM